MITRPSFSRTTAGITLMHSGQTDAVFRGRPRGAWNSFITRAGILVYLTCFGPRVTLGLREPPTPAYIIPLSPMMLQKWVAVTVFVMARRATFPPERDR